MSMRPILEFADLIGATKPKAFMAEHYDHKPCLLKGDPVLYQSLFNFRDFSDLLEMSSVWSNETLRIVLDGNTIDKTDYCQKTAGRDGFAVWRPTPRKVSDWMHKGASVVLDCAEHMHPGLRQIANAITVQTNARVNCNIYCSFDGHQAFNSHFDTMDVFVLQMEGQKKWHVYEGRFEQPIEAADFNYPSFGQDHHDRAKGKVSLQPVLKPGHFLYIPKGQYHDACATKGPSLHVTFGTNQPRGTDFIKTVFDSLVEVPEFRKALPDFDDVENHNAAIGALADTLHRLLQNSEIAKQMRDEQRRRTYTDFARYDVPNAIALDVFRVRKISTSFTLGASGYTLSVGTNTVNVPNELAEAVQWILKRQVFDDAAFVAATPELSETNRQTVLQTLERAGLLENINAI